MQEKPVEVLDWLILFYIYTKTSLMRHIIFALFLFYSVASFAQKEVPFGIVIHGGAGTILKANMTPALEQAYKAKLTEAVQAGHAILKSGGSSQAAVEKAIQLMEDSPLFNAGKGAVLTADAVASLDASFMDGKTLNAGAIAGVAHVKNPIRAAIGVMEKSKHVMLAGAGADAFAVNIGLDSVPNHYFITERRLKSLRRVQAKENNTLAFYDSFINNAKYGTVGCVALDQSGNIAAGTSTGGMTNKKWGRVGDAPIIGAGTYANNQSCGVSATGWGEFFIRSVVAHDIAALVEYKGLTVKKAAQEVLQKVAELGGDGGVIVMDRKGNVAMEFNTAGMYRAQMNAQGDLIVKIYHDE